MRLTHLPTEILLEIFHHLLDVSDTETEIRGLSQTCRQFYSISGDDSIWRRICERLYNITMIPFVEATDIRRTIKTSHREWYFDQIQINRSVRQVIDSTLAIGKFRLRAKAAIMLFEDYVHKTTGEKPNLGLFINGVTLVAVFEQLTRIKNSAGHDKYSATDILVLLNAFLPEVGYGESKLSRLQRLLDESDANDIRNGSMDLKLEKCREIFFEVCPNAETSSTSYDSGSMFLSYFLFEDNGKRKGSCVSYCCVYCLIARHFGLEADIVGATWLYYVRITDSSSSEGFLFIDVGLSFKRRTIEDIQDLLIWSGIDGAMSFEPLDVNKAAEDFILSAISWLRNPRIGLYDTRIRYAAWGVLILKSIFMDPNHECTSKLHQAMQAIIKLEYDFNPLIFANEAASIDSMYAKEYNLAEFMDQMIN
jgi:hypothetical protein